MIKKIASGYYEVPSLPVTLILGEYERVIEATAKAEIIKREDNSGWSMTLTATYDDRVVTLSEHDDVYDRKRDVIHSLRQRQVWQFVRRYGLNAWCFIPTREARS